MTAKKKHRRVPLTWRHRPKTRIRIFAVQDNKYLGTQSYHALSDTDIVTLLAEADARAKAEQE